MAAAGSWMEQGPTITARRSSLPVKILWKSWRAESTVRVAASVRGCWRITSMGVARVLISVMRRSSVDLSIFVGFLGYSGGGQEKSRLESRAAGLRFGSNLCRDQDARALASAGIA